MLQLASFTADIGRLVIRAENDRGDNTRNQTVHGSASIEVLSHLDILGQYGPFENALTDGISHHSDVKTPTMADLGNNKMSWIITGLLRDLDMMSIIVGKSREYVEDQETIHRQLIANKLSMTYIVQESILETFEAGQPIVRTNCRFFPEWLLQYLAWPRNFSFRETWDMAKKSRGYFYVLRWFKKNFEKENMKQFERIIAAAEKQYNLAYDLG